MRHRVSGMIGLMLALAGCAQRDVVLTSLEAIQAAATVALAAQPGGAALTALEVTVNAVPQAMAEYQSSDTPARKASLMAGYFAQALTATQSLQAKDRAIVAATVTAVQTLIAQLQQQAPAAGAKTPLSAQERARMAKILQDNSRLKAAIAQAER